MKIVNHKLTAGEKQLLKDVESGKFVSIGNLEKEKRRYQKIATATLKQMKKNKNVNLRISEYTLKKFKERAMTEGIPYQTLATSVLHKYAHGMFKPATK